MVTKAQAAKASALSGLLIGGFAYGAVRLFSITDPLILGVLVAAWTAAVAYWGMHPK